MSKHVGFTVWARQTLESEIFSRKPAEWFKIWFYIVSRVNYSDTKDWKRGSCFVTYDEIRLSCHVSRDQIAHCVQWLKATQMLATQKATRGMHVSVLNYALYQDQANYESNTESIKGALNKQRKRYTRVEENNKTRKEEPTITSEAGATPKQEATEFFESESVREETIREAIEGGIASEDFIRAQVRQFTLYWTEPTPDGKRQKWQKQETFEVKRRLVTWFSRASARGGQSSSVPKPSQQWHVAQ